jgi:hypothetical protein
VGNQFEPTGRAKKPTERHVLYAFLAFFLGGAFLLILSYSYAGQATRTVLRVLGGVDFALSAVLVIEGLRIARASAPGEELRRTHRTATSRFGKSARFIWQHVVPAEAPTGVRVGLGTLAVVLIAGSWLVLMLYGILVLVLILLVGGIAFIPTQPPRRGRERKAIARTKA